MRFSSAVARLSLPLCLVLAAHPASAGSATDGRFAFQNAEVSHVIAEVAKLTGTTFLFDPTRVKGKITVAAPDDIAPARALELLRSVLALHGYVLLATPEATWIVPASEVAGLDVVVKVIRLHYASAEDVAFTLAWAAPPGLRIADEQHRHLRAPRDG